MENENSSKYSLVFQEVGAVLKIWKKEWAWGFLSYASAEKKAQATEQFQY